jgi:hypothetical protein
VAGIVGRVGCNIEEHCMGPGQELVRGGPHCRKSGSSDTPVG